MKNRLIRLLIAIFVLILPISAFCKAGAVFVPAEEFNDYEYLTVKKVFEEHGITYFVFSDTYDTLAGAYGTEVQPFTVTDSIDPGIVDFLMIIGGPGILKYTSYEPIMELIRELDSLEVPIGAMKMAPVLIIKSGIVENEKICVFLNDLINKEIEGSRAIIVAYNVYVNGNIITSYKDDYVELLIKTVLGEAYETADPESE